MTIAPLTLQMTSRFRTKRLMAFAAPAVILAYFAYIFVAFDVAGLASRARMDNAAILLSDFWSYKTHVTRDNATGVLTVAIEGEKKGTYPPGWRKAGPDITATDPRLDQRHRYPHFGNHRSGALCLFAVKDGNLSLSTGVGAVFLYPRQPVFA